jgi:molybdenum cofactor biosynthesis enzyme MoaA|tara:strand:+ start:265 stop:531 length:267 start_codon:yes stop_codon:yes gene_type:complete
MKYLLVDKHDNIVTSVELASNVGVSGAKTYFVGTKRIDEKEFDKLWKVMTRKEYDTQFKATLQNRQMDNMKYKWWEEDKAIVDEELKI